MACPRCWLPPARALAEDDVPKRVWFGFYGNKESAGHKQIPQAGKRGRVEPQAGTRIYRQDDVEDCPTQTVIPVAGRPAAGRDPDKGSGQGGETSSLFGIGARRHVGERDPGSRQAVEDASGRSTTTRAKLENPHRLRLRPCRRQLGQRIAQQFDSGSDSRRTLKELFGHRRKRGIRLPDIVRKAFG